MQWRSLGPSDTAGLGRRIAASIPEAGLFISLTGPLGAGKTVFVKGAAEALGIPPEEVSSPTFVLANRYEGQGVLVHGDLYRIESEPELLAAGFLDWLEPGALVVAEWGDRFPDALPQDRLEVRIERTGDQERAIAARASGAASERVLRAVGAEETS